MIAAIWLLLRFTAPADPPGVACSAYQVEGKDAFGYMWSATPYDRPGGRRPRPRPPGQRDTIYVLLSEDGRYRRFRVAGVDQAGNRATWSNAITAMAGWPRGQVWWRDQGRLANDR